MRFKVDENLPDDFAVKLREAGHDALTVADEDLCGAPDDDVAAAALAEGRAIVTMDLHFADVRRFPPQSYEGIILLRLRGPVRERSLAILPTLLAYLQSEPLSGRLWIVDESSLRIRDTL